MKPDQSLIAQVTIGLSYDHSPQEKAYILQMLTERFGVRKVEEVPVDEPHERVLRFSTCGTIARSQPFLEFLEHQKRSGVLFEYELREIEEKKRQCSFPFALICRATSRQIARWATRCFK